MGTLSLCFLLFIVPGCTDTEPGEEADGVGTSDIAPAGGDVDPPVGDSAEEDAVVGDDTEVAGDGAAVADMQTVNDGVIDDTEVSVDLGEGFGDAGEDDIAVDAVSPPDGVAIQDVGADGSSNEDGIAEDINASEDMNAGDAGLGDEDTQVSPDPDVSDPPVEDVVPSEDTSTEPLDCEALIAANQLDPFVSGCSDGTREGFLDASTYPNLAACGGAWDVPGIHHPVAACNWEAGNDGINPQGEGCNVTDICAAGWHVCLGKDDVLAHNPTGCDGITECGQSPAFFVVRTSSIGAFYCAPDTIGDPASENDLFGCGDLGCPTKQNVCQGNLSVNSQTKCVPDVPCANCTGTQECFDGSSCIEGPCYPLTLGSHNLCKSIQNKPTSNCQCYFLGELDPSHAKYVEGDFETVICEPGSGGCGWCKPLDYFAKLYGATYEDVWDCGTNSTKEALNVVKTNPYEQGGVLCCRDFN
jgi:hypothetical protein